MMKTIVDENLISFKVLEQKIFDYVCELGRLITKQVLENYDKERTQGETAYVYLLDEAMQMDKIGLISTNLAEKIAMTVTESPYRVTAETISSTCGQIISSGGVWNMMQQLQHPEKYSGMQTVLRELRKLKKVPTNT